MRPAAVFPPGGQAGTEIQVKLLGDAAGERTRIVKLPASADGFAFYPTDGTVAAPTPNPFRVSPFPNVLEAEPNDDARQATPSPHGWPIAFNGVLDRPGDVDHFRFRAAKGDAIDVQAFAFRIGSPLDTVVAVLIHPARCWPPTTTTRRTTAECASPSRRTASTWCASPTR